MSRDSFIQCHWLSRPRGWINITTTYQKQFEVANVCRDCQGSAWNVNGADMESPSTHCLGNLSFVFENYNFLQMLNVHSCSAPVPRRQMGAGRAGNARKLFTDPPWRSLEQYLILPLINFLIVTKEQKASRNTAIVELDKTQLFLTVKFNWVPHNTLNLSILPHLQYN